jgi:hypothetical protein
MKSFWILKGGPLEHIYLRPIDEDVVPMRVRVLSSSTTPLFFLEGTRSGKEVRLIGTPLDWEISEDATGKVLMVFDPDDSPNLALATAAGNIVKFGDMGLEVVSFGPGVIPG